ncbi:helix-turn-helix domain-containing protein [Streptomyces sp. NBC_00631]|uniref:helix-turn-helix transcriptional regulator n=1 Tax=Streptomyces sp. NBC_00631 TaxID=2975793 RepID=UPI0030E3E7B6
MAELSDKVDALIASAVPLPPPAERRRLRVEHGLTQGQVADALHVRRPTVSDWEAGRAEPRRPEREAYADLLRKLAELHPDTSAERPDTGRIIGAHEFAGMFAEFERNAWRLEGRRRYAWHERRPEYAAFTAGRHVHWDAEDPWCRDRRAQAALGKRFRRVRVIDEPYTECQVYLLLQNTPRNAAAGEDIRFLTRGKARELGLPAEDFWLFDTRAVAVLHFDDADEAGAVELFTAPADVLRYAQARDAAWHHAVSQERMADGLGV